MLENLKNKKILILGFGREGKDTFLFLRKLFPKKVLGIADKKKVQIPKSKFQKVKLHLGKNYLKALKNYDIIIKSPGVPPSIVKPYLGGKQKITSQTEIFFSAFAPWQRSYGGPAVASGVGGDNCPGRIVGITGTKGKSTTTSLIYQILKKGGLRAHLVGNIGKPVLNLLFSATPKDIFVYELSSHQLHNLNKSPHIAVLLNIYSEHLDYYKNFKEYANAKTNIALHQTKDNFLIFNSEDKIVKEIAKKSKARRIPIKGKYYELDKNAARAVGKIFKIPSKIIEKAVKEFQPLPHRLEFVGIFKGITFYNDALATIPEATMAAIEALGDRVETIMLGGFERNIDFKNLAKKVLKSEIKTVILFPTTGERIWKSILKISRGRGVPKHFFVDNMKDAVKLAYENTKKNKICLLSTASSSFSIFRDYKEKGSLFKKYVKALSAIKKT